MRIERVGNTQLRIEITQEEATYDWFDALRVGLEAAMSDLSKHHAMSAYEIDAARDFVAALGGDDGGE